MPPGATFGTSNGTSLLGICTKNVLSLLLVFPLQVTVTTRAPPVAFAATAKFAVIEVLELTVTPDTVTPLPAFTVAGDTKPLPAIVTLVVAP